MLYLLMLLTCVFASPLAAETIGNIEYHLPRLKQGWEIANELQTNKKNQSRTVLYIPKNSPSRNGAVEFFGAHTNDLPIGGLDQTSLEKALQPLFPDQQIHVTILESHPTSVLYEWTAKKEKTVAYGLSRAFSTDQGSAILMYQTENASNFTSQHSSLIQTLKEAKLIPKPN